jgi:uncharacterized protein YndB with AHSA1/START domain
MRSPEAKDYWSPGVYREILKPERIVCTDSFSDEKGTGEDMPVIFRTPTDICGK